MGLLSGLFGGKAPEPVKRDIDQELSKTLEYMPKFAAAEGRALSENMPGLTRRLREADVEALEELGPRGREAILEANPLYRGLHTQAEEELALNGRLSGQDVREIEQATRASWGARGLNLTQPGAVAEVLERDAARRARQDRARNFAMTVAPRTDPRSLVTSAQGPSLQGGMNQVGGMVQDVFGYNANAMNAANINKSNRDTALMSGLMSLGGSLLGAGGQMGAAYMTGGLGGRQAL